MHILIIEDERKLASNLRKVLVEDRHTVDVANDGDDGYTKAASDTYDIIVLDRMLPGMDGMDVCRRLRKLGNQTPIIMITALGQTDERVAGLNIGADDYLTKPFELTELLARINALSRRSKAYDASRTLAVGDLTLDLSRHEARRGEKHIELTAKEFALLEFLMRHPGQVLTRAQITDHVWSYDMDSLSNVVDIYIHYLRDKIDRGFPRPLIKTVRGVGYRIEA